MSSNTKIIIAIIIGAAIGAGTLGLFLNPNSEGPKTNSEEKKPLYWVAPMDSNYRRDKPGKSPMGMDLIPVYEDESSTDDFGPGAVRVAPHVVNNLGVRTAPVELENMHTEISTVGYVQYDEDKLIHIHPRVDGWIEKLASFVFSRICFEWCARISLAPTPAPVSSSVTVSSRCVSSIGDPVNTSDAIRRS